ncbi:hypothetical protein [Amphritea japonica]|uniref:Uncharacterized protein n=1 Tax=Amphritea japonica ATCC BAA-1530 TaxID=1278309 RepID=A0A7R6PBW1_9GAMM|nr:hypothetical protein [Amphritea japonica]BBB25271.1 conserved hypothetical protein [Amphritea japonica ATCC BAA-1530]
MSTDSTGQTKVACDSKKLFIQVYGKQHPTGHSFAFYDLNNQQEQEWLSNQKTVESVDLQPKHPPFELWQWPWDGQPQRNVWLDIEAEQGPPIRVSLFDNVDECKRQEKAQDYALQPVVPMLEWTGLIDKKAHALPPRFGYLYLFRKGQLWRELLVSHNDAGQLEMRDIRLTDHRQGELIKTTDNLRQPVGKPLSELWIPIRQQKAKTSSKLRPSESQKVEKINDFEMAFSEVQWSAARINYLQSDAAARRQRCSRVWAEPSLKLRVGRLVNIAEQPAQRPRNDGDELLTPTPERYSTNLTSTHLSELFDRVNDDLQKYEKGGPAAVNTSSWGHPDTKTSFLYAGQARSAVMEKILLDEQNQQCSQVEKIWQATSSVKDIWADAKQRQIPGLLLPDNLFQMRHAAQAVAGVQLYQQLLLQRQQMLPNYRSAELLALRGLPPTIGGKENPISKFFQNEDIGFLGGAFHSTIRTIQRQNLDNSWRYSQEYLTAQMKNRNNQQLLADYFSLEGADYIAGFKLVTDLLAPLTCQPGVLDKLNGVDPLRPPVQGPAQQLVVGIFNPYSVQPLSAMLLPGKESPATDQPLPQLAVEDNQGDGRFRLGYMQQQAGLEIQLASVATFEVTALLALQKARPDLFTESRRAAQVFGFVTGKLAEVANTALSRVLGSAAGQSLERAMKVHGNLFNLLRSSDPLFHELTFKAHKGSAVDEVVLGIEDLKTGQRFGLSEAQRQYQHPGSHQKRFFGDISSADGQIQASTSRARAARNLSELQLNEVRFITAPANSEAVAILRRHQQAADALLQHSQTQSVAVVRNVDLASEGLKVDLYSKAGQLGKTVQFPFVMLVFEMWNLKVATTAFIRKREAKTGFNVLSAFVDITVASLNAGKFYHEYWASGGKNPNILARTGAKVVINNSPGSAFNKSAQAFSTRLAERLPQQITRVWIATAIAGVLSTAAFIWDAVNAFDKGDNDKGAALVVAAVGAGMMTAAGMLTGLGPVGWVGLALMLTGVGLSIWLSDTPLEEWIKHGPFGSEKDDAPWLQNEDEAYTRLLNLFAGIRISILDNGSCDNKGNRLQTISILSNLPEDAGLELYLRRRQNNITLVSTGRGAVQRYNRKVYQQVSSVGYNKIDGGLEIIVATPPSEKLQRAGYSLGSVEYDWAVKARWRMLMANDGDQTTFPSLKPLDDAAEKKNSLAEKPDFEKVSQPGWASELSHGSQV